MEKKDERPPRVPAGTFASSDPPPARRSEPGTSPALAEGVAHSSAPPPPDSNDPAIDRKRYTSTLMGHGAPPASDGAPAPVPPAAPVAPVLAPPRWRGAKAYLEGQEPKPRVSAIPTVTPLVAPEGPTGPMPSRVNTKLGPAPPPAPPPSATTPPVVPNPEAAIDQAIERMLEGQASVPMEVEAPETDDVDQLEELPPDELQDEPSERAVPLARLALKTAQVRAAPGQGQPGFAWEAPADDHKPREQAAPAGGANTRPESPVPSAAPPPPPPPVAHEPAPQRGAGTLSASVAEPASVAAKDSPRAGEPARAASAAALQAASRPAQLAPIAHSALGELRPDREWRAGSMLLAAIVLVGAGGWLVTKGGFRRSVPPPSAVVEPKAAPVTEPLPGAVPPAVPATAPTPPAVDDRVAAAEPPRASDSHASDSRSSHSSSRSSSRREQETTRESSASAREQGSDSDQPPVLRIVPQGTAPKPETASETPTRREVLDALEPLRPAVERCANGQHGIAQLDITVINTGVVTHAVVAGDFAGTPEGSCIALAARDAKFAPFQKPRFRVIFPYSL